MHVFACVCMQIHTQFSYGAGTYRNDNFGKGEANGAVVAMNGIKNMRIKGDVSDRPVVEFDGAGELICCCATASQSLKFMFEVEAAVRNITGHPIRK